MLPESFKRWVWCSTRPHQFSFASSEHGNNTLRELCCGHFHRKRWRVHLPTLCQGTVHSGTGRAQLCKLPGWVLCSFHRHCELQQLHTRPLQVCPLSRKSHFCLTHVRSPVSGAVQCTSCEKGRYHNSTNMTTCYDCNRGKFAEVSLVASCRVCGFTQFGARS